MSDEPRSLSALSGKPVILHFWAAWCKPCLAEIPDLIEAARAWPDVMFMTVSLDEAWAEVERYLPHAELPPNLISLMDRTKKVPEQYGTYQYPESYLIDKDGTIVMKWVGSQDWKSDKMKRFVERLLSEGKAPS